MRFEAEAWLWALSWIVRVRRVSAISILLAASCVDIAPTALPELPSPYFLVWGDERRAAGLQIEGPFSATSPPGPFALSDSDSAWLIGVSPETLERRYPAYGRAARETLRLVPESAELQGCADDGFLRDESELEVPLSEVGPVLYSWSPESKAWVPAADSPSALALRFETRACDDGPSLVASEFARVDESLDWGLLNDVLVLDPDTLLVTTTRALFVVRRGDYIDRESSHLFVSQLLPPPQAGVLEWQATAAVVLSGRWPDEVVTILVAMTLVRSGFSERDGGALAVATLHPSGEWRWGGLLAQRTREEGALGSVSLEALWTDGIGRYAAVGQALIVTGSSTGAAADIKDDHRFLARVIVPLDEPGVPHLMMGDRGEAFEGDVSEFEPTQVYDMAPSSDRVQAWARGAGPLDPIVVGTSVGLLYERVAPKDWRPHRLGLPASAGGCRGSGRVCGRAVLGSPITDLAVHPDGGGLFVAMAECSAGLFRSPQDPCASVVYLDDPGPVHQAGGLGTRAAVVSDGRLYVTVHSRYIYELRRPEE